MNASASRDVLGPLNEFISTAWRVNDIKGKALEKEAEALDLLLRKLYINMPLLDRGNDDPCYRGRLVLLELIEDNGSQCATERLTLYEDGQLTRSHVISQGGSKPFEYTEESEISCLDACRRFGFDVICSHTMAMFNARASLRTQEAECQKRYDRADALLEAMRTEIASPDPEITVVPQ